MQNACFGVEIGRVIVVHDRHGVLKGDKIRVGLVDCDAADGVEYRRLAETGNRNGCEDSHHAGDDDPFAFEQHAQILAQG